MADQQTRWRELRGELADEGLQAGRRRRRHPRRARRLEAIFLASIFPVLTPLAIDPAHPFPFIPNLAFSLVLKLQRARRRQGRSTPWCRSRLRWRGSGSCRRAAAAGARPQRRFLSLEGFLILFLDHLFPGCEVQGQGVFRLIRDSDVEIEEEAEDLVREFEARSSSAAWASVVRVEIDASMPDDLRDFIVESLHAEAAGRDHRRRPAGPGELTQLIPADRPDLKFQPSSRASPNASATTAATASRPSARRTSWSTTRSRASTWWCSSCARRRATPTCWRSSRRSTAPPRTARSSPP